MQLLEAAPRRRLPRWSRRLLILLAAALVLAVVLLFEPAQRRWRRWRADRALATARHFAQTGDSANAVLSVAAAAQNTMFDSAQLRIVGEVLEAAGSPDVLAVYRQLAEMDPTDVATRKNGVHAALRVGDVDTAESLLASLEAAQRDSPQVARLTADIAGASGRDGEREEALSALLAHIPSDAQAQLELAELHLRQPPHAEAARGTLRDLANSAAPQRIAARELLARDAVQRQQPLEAIRWAEAAATDPAAQFSTQLFELEVQHRLAAPGESRLLRALQAATSNMPDNAAALATWMLTHGANAATEQWLAALPVATRDAKAVRQVRADAAVVRRDWSVVLERLRAGAWGALNGEAIADAVEAQRLREGGNASRAREPWQAALSSARGSAPTLSALYRIALSGGDDGEIDATLRAIAQQTTRPRWALQQLVVRAYQRHDTARLRDVYDLWVKLDPLDARATADWAMATLLVDAVVSPLVEQRTRALYQRDPLNPHFATVRALCLWRAGHASDALGALSRLKPEQLRVPGRALVYAAILTTMHRRAEAEPYLAIARRAPLLPEEAAIIRDLPTGQ